MVKIKCYVILNYSDDIRCINKTTKKYRIFEFYIYTFCLIKMYMIL